MVEGSRASTRPKKEKKRGPVPEVLKIEGDWSAAVGRALAKGRPPKDPVKKKRRPK
jgi:hypothetical protein